ncbi:MAG: ATP-binding protein [Ginsengibacter sp.]
MKFYLTFVLLLFLQSPTRAQLDVLKHADSLRHQLSIATQDTSRVLLMVGIAEAYLNTSPDSALLYGQKASILSQEINFPKGEADALLSISVVLRELGNLPKALSSALKALKIAEDNHLIFEEENSLVRIANVYIASKDFPKALGYFKQAEKKLKNTSQGLLLAVVQMLSGDAYEQQNKLDSALYYEELAYHTMFRYGDASILQSVYRILGNIYGKSGNKQLALHYYQQGIEVGLKSGDDRSLSTMYTSVATFYKNQGGTDSAIYYAKQGLAYAEKLSYKKRMMAASSLLADLYDPIDARESLHYYKIANSAKDSLYSTEKVQAIEAINFDEQERHREIEAANVAYQNKLKQYALLAGLGVFLVVALILFRSNRQKQSANTKVEKAYAELKATQSQLVQQEKMASLGALTAGIAHEIQNPLNFVKNFSEVNTELLVEMKEEINKGNIESVKSIADDIEENEQKINHHGKRADAIVKGMLQHSRSSTGKKEPTDIKALTDEYLRLTYHGLRAKDKSFKSTMHTDYDESIGQINIVSQDIGRALLNLFNNAFYAITEKRKQHDEGYEPIISVSTKKIAGKVEIRVKDNGTGISQEVMDKIFQPFFTTKPSGQGTGLGLSLSYDIVKAHGGEIKVKSKEGEGSEFIIQLPT